ncbi:MAG: hypothetical protein ACD_46C00173G0001 [uncultured bacterium]|nr:MAG: hypothetical protein ACD_46C00173G0001 [uncultured bacterium]OGT54111.1 MAG: hypothetical protein A3F43_05815 [Gammaproteobacteria bacterium RIFCSPHIGHO2_12_FULL_42_10]
MDAHNKFDLKKSLIKKQTCFSKLTDAEIVVLADLLEDMHYNPGETIVTEGDPVDSVYFIIDGVADVRHVYVENRQIMFKSIATLSNGQSIGLSETGFYSLSGLRTATVVAKTALETFRLSIASFNGFALAYPHVHEAMRVNA